MSTDLEKKEQWIRDTRAEEDRIREMKKSHDYRKWAWLSNEIDGKFLELAELEVKLMKDYNIRIYTKYGLFRSGSPLFIF